MFEIITIDELLKRLNKCNHKELHVHHTWSPNHQSWRGRPDGLYWQEVMRKYHVENRKWQDIGQHVTLLPDGKFVTGRDFEKTPASIEGYNTGGFAVEMFGNFDKGHDKLQGQQEESIIKLAQHFHKKGRYIRFHRENSPKTCPGTSINKEEFMEKVKSSINTGADAVKWLADNKIINSPDYWLQQVKTVKYLDALLIKIVNQMKG